MDHVSIVCPIVEPQHTDLGSRIKAGEEAEIWVDSSKVHLFDPAIGENLTLDKANAGTIPQP